MDDDCDGQIDEGVNNTYYRDLDGDGYGNSSSTTQACSPPAGYVSNNTDCKDSDATVNPGATEGPFGNATCSDGKDNDCDGSIDSADSGCSINSIGEAVDNTSLTWSTGGYANWFGQTAVSYFGGNAAQSGDISDNQTSWVETTVTGPSTLSFYWKVSSEFQQDYLILYVDGVGQAWITGEFNWQQMTYDIPAGKHTVRWAYTKDNSVSIGFDAGWIDKVEIKPPFNYKIGVVRGNKWYLDYNGNGTWEGCGVDRCYAIGLSTDIPVVGNW